MLHGPCVMLLLEVPAVLLRRRDQKLTSPTNDGRTKALLLLCQKSPPSQPDGHIQPPDNHQDGMQPPFQPQYLFSIYAPWIMILHTELLIPVTRENRLSAHDVGRPRPPRRLLSQRKVTAAWSKLEIVHFRRLEMLI